MINTHGIFILATKGEWRVVLAPDIDTLYYWEDDSGFYLKRDEINPQELVNHFHNCNVLKSEYAAMEEAKILFEEILDDNFCPSIEFAITHIEGWEDKYYPVDLEPEVFDEEEK